MKMRMTMTMTMTMISYIKHSSLLLHLLIPLLPKPNQHTPSLSHCVAFHMVARAGFCSALARSLEALMTVETASDHLATLDASVAHD